MPLLKINQVSKKFGGLKALSEVSLELQEGQIRGLIGPNGSGKTTLFNVISGIYPLDGGKIFFGDTEITQKEAAEVSQIGIARTFQEIQLFYDMSVLENVMIGRHRLTKSTVIGAFLRTRQVKEEEKSIVEKARESLAFVGLEGYEEDLARNISYGHQRLLEVARAMAAEPTLLLLDEPAAGMNHKETADLMNFIRKIQGRGIAILLVEHNMKMVMDVCDVLTVINYGQVIAEGTPPEVQASEKVIEAYLGRVRREC
jgi:ABC-type branched-subunit amino acid transport system ATPase component